MSWLLESQAPNTGVAATEDGQSSVTPNTSSAPVSSPQTAATLASASQLADALIRSMFTSAGNVASLGDPGVAASRKTPVREMHGPSPQNAPATAVVPTPLLAMIQSPPMPPADTGLVSSAAAAKSVPSKLPFGDPVVPAAAKVAALVPLAFSMRLTPVVEIVAPALVAASVPASTAPVAASAPQPPPDDSPNSVAATEAQPGSALEPSSTNSNQPVDSGAVETDQKIRPSQQPRGETAVVTPVTPATANDGSTDLARQMYAIPNTAPAPASGKIQSSFGLSAESPVAPSAAQALRESEPSAPAAPAPPAAAVKEIAVRIATPQAPAVDVHLVERAGQLQVSVRTADGGLQTSLRQDLSSLVNSLQRLSYRVEAFTPRETSPIAAATAATSSQNDRQESEAGSGGRNGNPGDTSQDSGGGQQQQRRAPRQAKWVEEEMD